MKKYLLFAVLAIFSASIPVRAEMRSVESAATTIATAGYTNTYTVNGILEGALITIPATATATVQIVTSSGLSLYSGTNLTSATDGYVPLAFPRYNSNGTALTNTTGAVVEKLGVYDTVVFTVNPATGVTTTNSYSAKLLLNQ